MADKQDGQRREGYPMQAENIKIIIAITFFHRCKTWMVG
jgi:hypothetical protein